MTASVQYLLSEAVRARDLAKVQLLLRKGANVSARDPRGETLLCKAASAGCPEIVAVLLLHSAHPLQVSADFREPADLCSDKETRALLELFAGTDTSVETQRDALRSLALKPFLMHAVTEHLLQHGIELQPLQEPARSEPSVHGDSASESSEDGGLKSDTSALAPEWHVVLHSPTMAVRLEPSARSPVVCGKSLGELVQLGEYDETGSWRRVLVDDELGQSRGTGWMPLEHPVLGRLLRPHEAMGPEEGLPALLMPQSTEEDACQADGGNLANAVRRNDLLAVERLLRRGANPGCLDLWGETPLFEAVANGNVAIVAALLLHRANPASRSSSGVEAAAFAQDAGVQALLGAFGGKAAEGREALDQALRSLPSSLLRPVLEVLERRRVLSRAEGEAWFHADLARLEGSGPGQGRGWAPRTPPSAPLPPWPPPEVEPKAEEFQLVKANAAERDWFVVTFRPCIAVRSKPGGEQVQTLASGQILQLGDWDYTGTWRHCSVDGVPAGWLLTQHPLLGSLLRPCTDEEASRAAAAAETTVLTDVSSLAESPIILQESGLNEEPTRALDSGSEGSEDDCRSLHSSNEHGEDTSRCLQPGNRHGEDLQPGNGHGEDTSRCLQPGNGHGEDLQPGNGHGEDTNRCLQLGNGHGEDASRCFHLDGEHSEADAARTPRGGSDHSEDARSFHSDSEDATTASFAETQSEEQWAGGDASASSSSQRCQQPELPEPVVQAPAPLRAPPAPTRAPMLEHSLEELELQAALRFQLEEVLTQKRRPEEDLQLGAALRPGLEALGSQPALQPMRVEGDLEDDSEEFASLPADSEGLATPDSLGSAATAASSPVVRAVRGSCGDTLLGEGPLVACVQSQDLPGVLKWLELGAEPNARDALGETPLFEAVANGDVEIMAALLIYGADPTLQSHSGVMCGTFVEDVTAMTLLDLFEGVEVTSAARDEVLTALCPELRSAVMRKLGFR